MACAVCCGAQASEERNRRRKKFLAEYEKLQMEKLLDAQRRTFRTPGASASAAGDERTAARGGGGDPRVRVQSGAQRDTDPGDGIEAIMEPFDEHADNLRVR